MIQKKYLEKSAVAVAVAAARNIEFQFVSPEKSNSDTNIIKSRRIKDAAPAILDP